MTVARPRTLRVAGYLRRWLPLLVTVYACCRFAVVFGELRQHGVNPWVFALLDIGGAWPYGLLVARVVANFATDGPRACVAPAVAWAAVAGAPYAYVLASAHGLGPLAVAAIVAVAVAGAIASIAALRASGDA